MIFSEKSIEDLLSGVKTQTRRLVKEGEYEDIIKTRETKEIVFGASGVRTSKGKAKWICGHPKTQKPNYAVQSGRGSKGYIVEKFDTFPNGSFKHYPNGVYKKMKIPLRIVIKSIRKERLLDISLKDVKREGYVNKDVFLQNFYFINFKKMPKEYVSKTPIYVLGRKRPFRYVKDFELHGDNMWNPFVWVLDLEVVK
jgi:hypothetical protein